MNTTNDTATMHFKIIHGDEKRRIELPTPLAFAELRDTIATLFSDATTTVAPASVDITLAALNVWKPLKNDKDLARALRNHGASDKPMRLHVAMAAPAAADAPSDADAADASDAEAFAAAADKLSLIHI